MTAADIDVLVCRLTENVLYLSGYFPIVGIALMVFPREGDPVLLAPIDELAWVEDGWVSDVRTFTVWRVNDPGSPAEHIVTLLLELASEHAFPMKRIGFEGSFEHIAPPFISSEPSVPTVASLARLKEIFPESEFVDATGLLHRVRGVKTPREVESLRRTNEIAGFGFLAWEQACRDHATEAEAAAAFEYAVSAKGVGYNGARSASAWAWVSSGPATGISGYLRPQTTRRISDGDFVLSEVSICVDGFWADLARTIVVGEPTESQRELFELTKASLELGVANLTAGARAGDIDEMCRTALGERSKYLPHHVGHGIGVRLHEPVPLLVPGSDQILEAGMVCCIEPAVYIPDVGGIRNEHMVHITAGEPDVLSADIPIGL